MKPTTLLVLLVLVGGLAAFLFVNKDEQGAPELVYDYAFFEGLASERVHKVRVDHLQRSVQVTLERDRVGSWFLTDPLPYPAMDELVTTLLGQVARFRGRPAPPDDLSAVGLDPPLVVLELSQSDAAGASERVLRMEIGAVDVDPSFVYVRIPDHPAFPDEDGAVLRAPRSIFTTLDRNPNDYRDPRATHFVAQQVVSIRRSGTIMVDAQHGRVDLALEAINPGDGWRTAGERQVALDPQALGLLVRGAAEMRVSGFLDDSPRDLAPYGLDDPAFSIELQNNRRETVTLHFGYTGDDPDLPVAEQVWLCMRAGFGHVWQVGQNELRLLTRPTEVFFDNQVLRAVRQDVQRVELVDGERTIELTRVEGRGDQPGEWQVVERAGDGGRRGPFPADESEVGDLLTTIEKAQISTFPLVVGFEAMSEPTSFTVLTRTGGRLGGEFGRVWSGGGLEGRLFLRHGDGRPGLVALGLEALCQRPLDSLRRRQVWEQLEQELGLRQIDVTHGGRTFSYVRSGQVWTRANTPGATVPRAFEYAVDPLCNLRAVRWLDGDEPLVDTVHVALLGAAGQTRSLEVGRTSTGVAAFELESGARGEVDAELLKNLLDLFD